MLRIILFLKTFSEILFFSIHPQFFPGEKNFFNILMIYQIVNPERKAIIFDSKLGQGRDAVKEVLKDNPELAEEIEAKIVALIKGEPVTGEVSVDYPADLLED